MTNLKEVWDRYLFGAAWQDEMDAAVAEAEATIEDLTRELAEAKKLSAPAATETAS